MLGTRESLSDVSRIGGARRAVPAVVFLGLLLPGLQAAPLVAGEAEASEESAAADAVPSASGTCVESSTVLCLQEDRYEVTLEFTANDDTQSARVARPRTSDSGLFYFFEPNNWEMLLKVLDGCGVNEHHWVFAASATDVGLNLTVRDTTSGESKTYTKDPGEPAPAITDVGAFPNACEASS